MIVYKMILKRKEICWSSVEKIW